MSDPSSSRAGRESTTGMSRWVKVTLVALVLAAFIVVLMLVVSSGDVGGHQIPEHAPPPGSLQSIPTVEVWRRTR